MMNITGNVMMDKLPPWCDLGETVFAILGPGNYCQGQVSALRSWVAKNNNGEILVMPDAARLSTFTFTDYFSDIEHDAVPFKYLTNSEKEAKRQVEEYKVDISEEEWMKAIGKRVTLEEIEESVNNHNYDIEESIEDSELGVCCANIDSIRDILTKCWKNGKIIFWEIQYLQEHINFSNHDFPEDAPTLKKILKQLNVNWS